MNQNWEEIIWRALRNECSSEELMKLQEWRNETPENEQMYVDVKGIAGMGNFLKGIDSLHKENALENILKRTRQRSLGHSRLLKYVAVFLLPLLLGGTLFYFLKFKQQVGEELPVSVAKQILPGGPKAILYLSDGQVIDLNRTIDSVIVDKHSGQEITLSKDINALNYSGVTGNTTQPKELAYNRIEVPRGGEYMLVLSDGTKVWLNSETRLEYPLTFGEHSRDVRLSGEAYFEVIKDEARHFNVIMEGAIIEVTGTSFNASCYPGEGQCRAVLESGKINLRTEHGVAVVDVGECASYDIVSGKVTVEAVDLKYFTSWRYGTFYFYNTPLSEIVQKLGRWYDVNFKFADESLRDVCFSGAALRSKSIDFMLELLASTQSLKFDIQGDGIIMIYKK